MIISWIKTEIHILEIHMLLAGLALLPTIVLVAWIYRQDKVEKEPKGLLWKIFLFGVLSVIPAMILEIIFEEILLVFV